MRFGRRGVGAIVALGLVGPGLVLSGCGTSDGPAAAKATTTSTARSATPTTDSEGNAVLAAYRASWSAFEQALATANPNDPSLTATMVNPQLEGVKANLVADQRQGVVGRGTTTLHPTVVSISTTRATVVD
ncbi:MAG: hypothetical protein ACRDVP_00420, partial [Acidimicrobiales bacterium]